MLQSSGDRVRFAVQRILGVQGSLEELKEDLSTEYRRWKTKKQELLDKRQQVQLHIQEQQAKLLKQRTLTERAGRLRGDLALVTQASRSQNQSHKQQREASQQQRATLKWSIQTSSKALESTHQESWAAVAAFHKNTEALRRNGSSAALEAINANKTITEFEEARAKSVFASTRDQSVLLKDLLVYQKQQGTVKNALQVQAQLQWEYGRLADQAHEVLKRREGVHVGRESCDLTENQLHDQITETSGAMQEDTAAMRRCQLQQALNAKLTDRANECRAAVLSQGAVGSQRSGGQ